MKQIRLESITLTNFKGIAQLTVPLNGTETTIAGANGTGKTTIFDAFTWLLFGKDSQDRKDFDIKTIGSDGKAIARLPHEVSAVLNVDGAVITIKKTYTEKWTKRRGSVEEVFDGHDTAYFFNDVPMKSKDYAERIADLCPESVFKFITNPLYFTSQKPDVQRQMLFRFAGELQDDTLLSENKEFEEVASLLQGKSITDLRKEISAKKKQLKAGIDTIPARIEERKSSLSTQRDRKAVEADITALQQEINAINDAISDRTKAYDTANANKQELAQRISQKQSDLLKRTNDLRAARMDAYYKALQQHNDAKNTVNSVELERKNVRKNLELLQQDAVRLQENRSALLQAYKALQAETLTFDENAFVCPTCHRQLDAADIETKKAEMLAAFNVDKARRLEENKAKGLHIKEMIEGNATVIEAEKQKAYDLDVTYNDIVNSEAYKNAPALPETADIDAVINADPTVQQLRAEIDAMQSEMANEVTPLNCETLLLRRTEKEDKRRELEVELTNIEVAEINKQRIAELEKEYREQQQALAELERVEYQVDAYNKARTRAIEKQVNSMFRVVKFKLFDTQVNGSEVETCEAMVDGIPFSTLNKAKQLNTGLDIINTICEKEGISAPIFIDNRESVTNILPPENAQIINLKVDRNCHTLTVQ